jgi:hypothetical protein
MTNGERPSLGILGRAQRALVDLGASAASHVGLGGERSEPWECCSGERSEPDKFAGVASSRTSGFRKVGNSGKLSVKLAVNANIWRCCCCCVMLMLWGDAPAGVS